MSLICFTQCDTASAIIDAAYHSFFEVFCVTTMVFFGQMFEGGRGVNLETAFSRGGVSLTTSSLAFVDGDDLILISVSTQLFMISFSVTSEENIPEDVGKDV